LPGERREIEIEYPLNSSTGTAQLAIRGWNAGQQIVSVEAAGTVQ
jgi:hypothetical protein